MSGPIEVGCLGVGPVDVRISWCQEELVSGSVGVGRSLMSEIVGVGPAGVGPGPGVGPSVGQHCMFSGRHRQNCTRQVSA